MNTTEKKQRRLKEEAGIAALVEHIKDHDGTCECTIEQLSEALNRSWSTVSRWIYRADLAGKVRREHLTFGGQVRRRMVLPEDTAAAAS